MHALWRHRAPSPNALLALVCDGPIPPARVGAVMERYLQVCPWPASRLGRPLPWGRLRWTAPRDPAGRIPLRHRMASSPREAHEAIEGELNDGLDPRRAPPVRLLVVDGGAGAGAGRCRLVLTWFHPLMDPRGGQNLVRHLARLDGPDGGLPWGEAPPALVPEPDRRSLGERGRAARAARTAMRELAGMAIVSPGTGRSGTGATRFRLDTFVEEPGAGGGRPARDAPWKLAVVGRAMAELWRGRGLPDTPFLVPVAVDRRRAGDADTTFGNLLAFHFARFRPSDTADPVALAATLRRQLADAVRDGRLEAGAVALDFLAYRPLSRMLRELPGTAWRETFSFFCADVGQFSATAAEAFGRRVVNAYHVPAIVPRPGIGVFFNRCGALHNLVVAWHEGVVAAEEVARIAATVREGMGWTVAG